MKKLVFLFFLMFFYNFTYGCTCIGKSKLKNEFKSSNVIIAGEIISKRNFDVVYLEGYEYLNRHLVEYTILVKKYFKGEKVTNDTIKIITGVGTGDCGYNFSIGSYYIIYAVYNDKYFEDHEKVDKFLYTNICTRNDLYSSKEACKLERMKKRLK